MRQVGPSAQVDQVAEAVQRDACVAWQPGQKPLFERTVREYRQGNGAVDLQALKRKRRLGGKGILTYRSRPEYRGGGEDRGSMPKVTHLGYVARVIGQCGQFRLVDCPPIRQQRVIEKLPVPPCYQSHHPSVLRQMRSNSYSEASP